MTIAYVRCFYLIALSVSNSLIQDTLDSIRTRAQTIRIEAVNVPRQQRNLEPGDISALWRPLP